MSVNAVQQTGVNYTQKGEIKESGGLGKDSFLQLLITQMRYQDPLEPVKDTEYIAQLAQFNSLEQMQNLNDKFDKMLKWSQMTQASSLIGKQIEGLSNKEINSTSGSKFETTKVSGIVKEVKFVKGEPRLVVGQEEITLGDIARIY